jgi:hypothetical protein
MIVKDKHVEAALEYLNAQPHPISVARYNMVVAETAAKAAYAKAFLEASGTVKERECEAEISLAYQEAKAMEADAIMTFEDQRTKQKRADAIIDVWKSEQYITRTVEKVR